MHDAERYRWFSELAADVYVELSPEAHVLYVSPNVRSVFGFAPEELVGGSAFAHVHPEDLRHAQTEYARRAGQVTCRHRHKDGSWRWVSAVRRDMMGRDGVVSRVAVVRDVTAQITAEEACDKLQGELVRLGKLATLGVLAGGIAHDFNNVLTPILAHASHARMETQDAGIAEALDHVLHASERARQLTRRIVTFSRHEAHEPFPVQLAPIVQEALGLLKPLIPMNVELRTELPIDAGIVLADACEIYQVVLNLCHNALHAMKPNPGRLTITLQRVPAPPTPGAPGFVCLSVADTGRGMDAGTRKRIFEPFFTTKLRGEGTGLGLAVVDRILREHGATIRVASEPGRGATFDLMFPLFPGA